VGTPAVFVFAMHGCGACEEYVPRFERVVRQLGVRYPIGRYDIAKDRRASELATRLNVQATPTTVVMTGGKLHKYVGAVDDAKIRQILRQAGT
jgi:thioredoxin-like negative regulator of GroEL